MCISEYVHGKSNREKQHGGRGITKCIAYYEHADHAFDLTPCLLISLRFKLR